MSSDGPRRRGPRVCRQESSHDGEELAGRGCDRLRRIGDHRPAACRRPHRPGRLRSAALQQRAHRPPPDGSRPGPGIRHRLPGRLVRRCRCGRQRRGTRPPRWHRSGRPGGRQRPPAAADPRRGRAHERHPRDPPVHRGGPGQHAVPRRDHADGSLLPLLVLQGPCRARPAARAGPRGRYPRGPARARAAARDLRPGPGTLDHPAPGQVRRDPAELRGRRRHRAHPGDLLGGPGGARGQSRHLQGRAAPDRAAAVGGGHDRLDPAAVGSLCTCPPSCAGRQCAWAI